MLVATAISIDIASPGTSPASRAMHEKSGLLQKYVAGRLRATKTGGVSVSPYSFFGGFKSLKGVLRNSFFENASVLPAVCMSRSPYF